MVFQDLRGDAEVGTQKGRVLILTSNQNFGAWGEVFGDPIIASAILNRLLHHSSSINIKMERYVL